MISYNILKSAESVVKKARYVFLDKENLKIAAEKILKRWNHGLETQDISFGSTGNFEKDTQLVFVEDTVNFSFWSGAGEPKWCVEWPKGKIITGGWYALKACFDRGLKENPKILDADYLSSISLNDARDFFRGADNVEIPLLKERVENLRETGKVLLEKFHGKFINAVRVSNFDALKLVDIIVENFPSFRDASVLDGEEIFFLKRAQIVASDISYVLSNNSFSLKNMEHLTVFADYKLPQILRMFGIIKYSAALAEKIDSFVELPHDSREEIEIRAVAIYTTELLRQKIEKMTAWEIDNTLWLMSQDIQDIAKPYHRTRTIYY